MSNVQVVRLLGVSSFVYQFTPDWPIRRDKLSQCADAKQAHHLDIGHWTLDIKWCGCQQFCLSTHA
jgi:hypothetical protein